MKEERAAYCEGCQELYEGEDAIRSYLDDDGFCARCRRRRDAQDQKPEDCDEGSEP
jgi:hypothetical protein